jgi:hypothetical protein
MFSSNASPMFSSNASPMFSSNASPMFSSRAAKYFSQERREVHRQFVEIDTDGSGALDRRARAPAPPGPFLEGGSFNVRTFVRAVAARRPPAGPRSLCGARRVALLTSLSRAAGTSFVRRSRSWASRASRHARLTTCRPARRPARAPRAGTALPRARVAPARCAPDRVCSDARLGAQLFSDADLDGNGTIDEAHPRAATAARPITSRTHTSDFTQAASAGAERERASWISPTGPQGQGRDVSS